MPAGFYYENSELVCDGVPLTSIAATEGTPLYVYSAAKIRDAYRAIDAAFHSHAHTLHYALKANSTLAIIRLLRELGSSADANSGGEIEVALRAGFIPRDIVFTGVGKTRDELDRAISLGVNAINAESPGELDRIDAIARTQGTRARVALRVNPDIDPQSHPHISTGLRTSKFGVPLSEAREVYRQMAQRKGLELVGIHIHIGSQIITLGPLKEAAVAASTLARALRDDGILIEQIDLGGGLGISYDGTSAPTFSEYAVALLDAVRDCGAAILLEPGRIIVGTAGILVGRVVDVKGQRGGKQFAVLDAGMTELLRPALYGAFHRIEPIARRGESTELYDVVGPLCESSDVLGTDRRLPAVHTGDLLAIMDVGAYGSVMASNYNRRPMPAEVLINEGRWRVIRRRQSVDDLLALES